MSEPRQSIICILLIRIVRENTGVFILGFGFGNSSTLGLKNALLEEKSRSISTESSLSLAGEAHKSKRNVNCIVLDVEATEQCAEGPPCYAK
mgnify:CR=1 FL=1